MTEQTETNNTAQLPIKPEDFNRFNDVFFKYLFAKEKRKHLMIDLLNSIFDDRRPVGIKGHITDISFGNVELNVEHKDEKIGFLDIKVTTDMGEIIDVEVQTYTEPDIGERNLFYFARLYAEQKNKGLEYKDFKPVIVVNLLSFIIFHDREKYHSSYSVREDELNDLLTDKLSIQFIEAPKCNKGKVKVLNRLGRWIQYLTFSDPSEIKYFAKTDKVFADVLEAEKMFRSNPEDMDAYLSEENAKFRLENILRGKLEEGEAKGRAKEKIDMARNLLKLGVSVDIIKQASHLSDAEIAAL